MVRLLLSILAAALLSGCATAPVERQSGQAQRVADAFHLGFPLYEMARVRADHLRRAEARKTPGINSFAHRRGLSDHNDRTVTTPNNDTLYSAAWLDLAAGPAVIDVPATGARYFSLAFLDMFTDNFAYAGTRVGGGRAERLFVVGPSWQGRPPSGVRLVQAPTNDVWALARTLVDGPSDLQVGRAVQDRLIVRGVGLAAAPSSPIPLRPTPEQFLEVVNLVLGRGPLPRVHAARIRRLAPLGIRPGVVGAWSDLPAEVRERWRAQWPSLHQSLRGGLDRHVTRHQGWSYPNPGLGDFGQDDAYRAAIALEGLAALGREEAMYMFTRTTADGQQLDGRSATYRLRLPSQVPVDAFWSLSMYEVADDRLFFVANSITRYSVGNRTAGLVRNADGSLDILMSTERPDGPLAANWLPAPRGPFRLGFRAYLPKEEFRSGRFRLPGVEKVDTQRLTRSPQPFSK